MKLPGPLIAGPKPGDAPAAAGSIRQPGFFTSRKGMIMIQDDLTKVKHVGVARMKVLNDLGITTVEQLFEMPLEKLAEIKSIGGHYAKLIKNSVNEYCGEISKKLPVKASAAKEKKIEEINRNLQKTLKRLNKNLSQVDEKLKPLWKKKYLEYYLDFKKRSAKLKARLDTLDQIQANLPQKVKKTIINKAAALMLTLTKVGKKPKKNKYNKIKQAIQSYSRMLRDIIS